MVTGQQKRRLLAISDLPCFPALRFYFSPFWAFPFSPFSFPSPFPNSAFPFPSLFPPCKSGDVSLGGIVFVSDCFPYSCLQTPVGSKIGASTAQVFRAVQGGLAQWIESAAPVSRLQHASVRSLLWICLGAFDTLRRPSRLNAATLAAGWVGGRGARGTKAPVRPVGGCCVSQSARTASDWTTQSTAAVASSAVFPPNWAIVGDRVPRENSARCGLRFFYAGFNSVAFFCGGGREPGRFLA